MEVDTSFGCGACRGHGDYAHGARQIGAQTGRRRTSRISIHLPQRPTAHGTDGDSVPGAFHGRPSRRLFALQFEPGLGRLDETLGAHVRAALSLQTRRREYYADEMAWGPDRAAARGGDPARNRATAGPRDALARGRTSADRVPRAPREHQGRARVVERREYSSRRKKIVWLAHHRRWAGTRRTRE